MGDSWEDAKRYVEPVVAEIDQPSATLLRVSVVLGGDGQESVSSEFPYAGVTAARNAALLRHAITLLQGLAERLPDPPSSGEGP